mmetsp:Transcript_12947/g.34395  ORF Transcript_12947/g.34395 Transcript_12947/m.34395 type:complete len:299 (-) Transcript_12947:437-1333(-)
MPSSSASMNTATARQVAGLARARSHRSPTANSPRVKMPSPSASKASKQSAGLIDRRSSSAAQRTNVARASSPREPASVDVALPNNGASGVETQARLDRRLHPRSASHQSQRVATAAFSSLPRHLRSCSTAPWDGSRSTSQKDRTRAVRRSNWPSTVVIVVVVPRILASTDESPSNAAFVALRPRNLRAAPPPEWHSARNASASASETTTKRRLSAVEQATARSARWRSVVLSPPASTDASTSKIRARSFSSPSASTKARSTEARSAGVGAHAPAVAPPSHSKTTTMFLMRRRVVVDGR